MTMEFGSPFRSIVSLARRNSRCLNEWSNGFYVIFNRLIHFKSFECSHSVKRNQCRWWMVLSFVHPMRHAFMNNSTHNSHHSKIGSFIFVVTHGISSWSHSIFNYCLLFIISMFRHSKKICATCSNIHLFYFLRWIKESILLMNDESSCDIRLCFKWLTKWTIILNYHLESRRRALPDRSESIWENRNFWPIHETNSRCPK